MSIYMNDGNVAVVATLNGPLSFNNYSNTDHNIAPFQFGVNSPDPKFTGRLHELILLSDATINHSNVSGHQSPIVVVCGLGGIGKTQLVRKFIEIKHTHYTNVIWINSEEYRLLVSQFVELATSYLKISTESNGKQKDLENLIGEVFQKLSASSTLIVLDNIDETKDNEVVKVILTSATRPHVLITSRIQKWSDSIHRINLDVFNEDDALKYVTVKLINPDNVHNDSLQDKKLLVEKLQYFPLTLAQSISYINDHRVVGKFNIGNYLTEYNSSTERILDSRCFQNDELNLYGLTTLTTWTVTINAINKLGASGDLALRILRTMSNFNPDHIRRDIFYNLKTRSEKQEVKSAVSLLVKYSMVGSQKQESVLNIHGLVQQVTKIKLNTNSDLKITTLRDGFQLISEMQQEDKFIECCEHGILLFREAIGFDQWAFDQWIHEYKTIPTTIIETLIKNHKYSRGTDFGDEILMPLTNILGENDLAAVNCKFVTANSYYNLGKNEKALGFYIEV